MENKNYMNQSIQKNDDYMFSKIQKNDEQMTQKPIDPRIDFGKGISYYTCDGKVASSMEQVMQYNQMYYERMKIKEKDEYTEIKSRMHR